jgi:hypothetical protein
MCNIRFSYHYSHFIAFSAKNSYIVAAARVPVGRYDFTIYIADSNNRSVNDAGAFLFIYFSLV